VSAVGTKQYFCEHAWLGAEGVAADVLVTVREGRFTEVTPGAARPLTARWMPGLTVPGLANNHSHAFHRALRARTQVGSGSFWTWREQMYAVAERLDPDRYLLLARAVFAEMALAGITTVGEFHYVHHGAGGQAYDDPNVMGHALVQAARAAGIRLTLLDTCYLTGGIGQPLAGVQERFGDGSADRWANRVEALAEAHARDDDVVVGAALHSVRGVPIDQMPAVVHWADSHTAPLHVHLSEQVAENEACVAAYGRTPTQVLADAGALGPRLSGVHATHLTSADIALLGGSSTITCLCPTTERDLADGIGPARALADAGSPLSLGSDSQSVVDLFEEARAVELDERLATTARGHFTAEELLGAATAHGPLGWPDAGRIAPGFRADLVSLKLVSVRTAGCGPSVETAVFAATSADVQDVVVGGRDVVRNGGHLLLPHVGESLARAVTEVLS